MNTLNELKTYCNNLVAPYRLETIEVSIGDLKLGGKNPIRIQSMTTKDTMDTEGTIAESIRMIEAGCELVRITAPSKLEAENLLHIKEGLRKKGYTTPLVADIHFTPNAAEIAARIVEKVRVNPGNYADKKKFEEIQYTESSYQAELDRIYKKFTPLVKICKEYGTAMRIGTNHGSLSDRIMSRFGDTPHGMVESALEFIRMCESLNYYNLVISMKSSNVQVMVEAYRLLVSKMLQNGKVYPLHLGVTEAGEGEDGRVKSAMGIGALLADGIGDTIRVSLTEAPEFEMPVANYIVNHFQRVDYQFNTLLTNWTNYEPSWNPFEFERRKTNEVENIGSHNVPRVVADFSKTPIQKESDLALIGQIFDPIPDKWNMLENASDYIYAGKELIPFMLPNGLKAIYDYDLWKTLEDNNYHYPFFQNLETFLNATTYTDLNFVQLNALDLINDIYVNHSPILNQQFSIIPNKNSIVWVLDSEINSVHIFRTAIQKLIQLELNQPVIIKQKIKPVQDLTQTTEAAYQLEASCVLGALLVDGLIDGVWQYADEPFRQNLVNQTVFSALQAARQRITKTEYISCPSCGRTLFDLQETTAMIRKVTEHLKGVKIGIMGCIVNGPGEMADADYGYVGSGIDQITLYKGKEVMERAIKTEFAVARLIELIKEDGRWIDA